MSAPRIFGVIGDPISHSASPRMHHAACRYLGLSYCYLPFRVATADLPEMMSLIRQFNFLGVNVTIPHKESVIKYMDELDATAQKIGAVNTIVNKSGKLIGFNTDGDGLLMALQEEAQLNLSGLGVVIIGAGGAAKGIAYALLQAGVGSLTILNRNVARATALAAPLQKQFPSISILAEALDSSAGFDALHQADLVIQATSVGMAPNILESPLKNYEWVKPSQICYDIIYKPAQTRFMGECTAQGARAIGGAGMLAGQGIEAFYLFTGQTVPYPVMRDALNE